MVGQRHFHYEGILGLISELHLAQDVLMLEQVSDLQLPAIYRHAKGFVYTSWAEGFGMPLLEAMASGIPVITSANTALSEVSAGAALLVDPSRPDEVSAAVLKIEQQPQLRKCLVDRGESRAKEFNWERSAQKLRSVYLRHFGLLP
jgi:glycosyltransferase involved in cell wall biosynthesis